MLAALSSSLAATGEAISVAAAAHAKELARMDDGIATDVPRLGLCFAAPLHAGVHLARCTTRADPTRLVHAVRYAENEVLD